VINSEEKKSAELPSAKDKLSSAEDKSSADDNNNSNSNNSDNNANSVRITMESNTAFY
jgi:hypothetical protein